MPDPRKKPARRASPAPRAPPAFYGVAPAIHDEADLEAAVAVLLAQDPESLVGAGDAVLRGVGLSIQKIRTLRAIGEAVRDGSLVLDALADLPAEAAVERLIAIKGVGPWTADVFLLFCLGHADAWPAGDIALQEAARIALKLETRPDKAALEAIGERWRPRRAVAARLLWSYYRAAKRREGIGLDVPPPA
jgi:DNA-3-methyladenine glycosylase II